MWARDEYNKRRVIIKPDTWPLFYKAAFCHVVQKFDSERLFDQESFWFTDG
jgi:hypothetical protein